MIRELLICSASGVPHAPSTQKQRRKTPLEASIKHSGCRKWSSLPSRQDPLPKHADGGAQRSSKFKRHSSLVALILQPAQTLSKPGHTLLCEMPSMHIPTHTFSSSCAFSHVSPSISAHAHNFARTEQSGGAERGWQRRWKRAMTVQRENTLDVNCLLNTSHRHAAF